MNSIQLLTLLLSTLLTPFISAAQHTKPTPRSDYKFSKPHYLKTLKQIDTLFIDTSVIYVSMMKKVHHNTNQLDTAYHVFRFFGNGVYFSKSLETSESLILEMNHPCAGGNWGMYTLAENYIIMESEEMINKKYARKYTHAILDENELYIDHFKIGNKMFKLGGEAAHSTYLKKFIELRNWNICWQKHMISF